jgi:hypothetical protein
MYAVKGDRMELQRIDDGLDVDFRSTCQIYSIRRFESCRPMGDSQGRG